MYVVIIKNSQTVKYLYKLFISYYIQQYFNHLFIFKVLIILNHLILIV